jgi:hypothetical protein
MSKDEALKKANVEKFFGLEISHIEINAEDHFCIHFASRYEFSTQGIRLVDNIELCCESRYFRTDDNLNDFVGSKFMGIALKNTYEGSEQDFYTHDIQFFEIITSTGVITLASHNEHNGYYGGFNIEVFEL